MNGTFSCVDDRDEKDADTGGVDGIVGDVHGVDYDDIGGGASSGDLKVFPDFNSPNKQRAITSSKKQLLPCNKVVFKIKMIRYVASTIKENIGTNPVIYSINNW